MNAPRLPNLTTHQGDAHALLLQSIAATHADVLSYDDITQTETVSGVPAVAGFFTHKPSGRVYCIAISAVPESKGSHS